MLGPLLPRRYPTQLTFPDNRVLICHGELRGKAGTKPHGALVQQVQLSLPPPPWLSSTASTSQGPNKALLAMACSLPFVMGKVGPRSGNPWLP